MRNRTFGDTLDACASHYHGRTALSYRGADQTYAEAVGRLRALGRALRASGLQPGDRVALVMKDTPDMATALYGALWAGLTVVPLNPRLSLDDHVHMVQDSAARALLFDDAQLDRAAAILERADVDLAAGACADAHSTGAIRLDDLVAGHRAGPRDFRDVPSDHEAWIQYTGGTTGTPKGAIHTHETMLSAFVGCALDFDVRRGEVCAHVTPLSHSGAANFFPVWMRGGTNVLLGGFDPDELGATIRERHVTRTLLVPTMIGVLLDAGFAPGRDTSSSLETIVYGAAPIERSLLERALDAFGPVFLQGYGQTEAFSQICALSKEDHATAVEHRPELLLAAGRPVTIADVALLDDDDVPAPLGETGEIVVRGPHIFTGYLNNAAATEETLAGGWLHTGDIGRCDEDGYVYLVDRKKDMIVSGGYNVYPKEVEQVLDDHPAVRQACVIGVPDDRWGEAVKALVVASHPVEAQEILAFVKARKGSVMCPKTVEFVDALPLTALGKIDKKTARAPFWAGRDRAVN